MILHDFYCPECGRKRKNVYHQTGQPPVCAKDSTPMRIDWSHGQAPATDLGPLKIYTGLDAECSSTRQAEKLAQRRAEAWTNDMQRRGKNVSWKIDGVAGDKQGGARDVRRISGSAFSYRKQGSRISTGEGH